MAFDDIIRVIGEFGPYQRRILFLLLLPAIPCGFHVMIGVFLAAKPHFRCLLPHENSENATYHLPPNITRDYKIKNLPQCERYEPAISDSYNISGETFSSNSPPIQCDSFVYDKTTYELTATTEFNLICDKEWLRATADSLFMAGMMVGCLFFGELSDRYGRKPIVCFIFFLQLISQLLVAVSPDIISYMIFRFIVGSSVNGMFIISYVSVVEMVVPEKRLLIGTVAQIWYAIGHLLSTAFAYFITNWRILQIAITIPNFVFLVYWWLIPESARWLVTTGRLEEAKKFFKKASSENGVEMSEDTLDIMLRDCTVAKSNLEKHSVLDLFRYPNLRRKTILLFLNWFVINFVYYGISWNTSSLAGNDYINFALSSLVELPANIFVFFALNRRGRRIILCSTVLLTGICLLLRIFVPHDISWLEVALTMIGKLLITASYTTVYVFSAEIFPTVIRNAGVGACSTCSMIGGILSSYVNYSAVLWKPLPMVIFGSCSLIAGVSAMLLPETLNEKLPESIEDGEQFGKKIVKTDKAKP